jgi:hypothetical protein
VLEVDIQMDDVAYRLKAGDDLTFFGMRTKRSASPRKRLKLCGPWSSNMFKKFKVQGSSWCPRLLLEAT